MEGVRSIQSCWPPTTLKGAATSGALTHPTKTSNRSFREAQPRPSSQAGEEGKVNGQRRKLSLQNKKKASDAHTERSPQRHTCSGLTASRNSECSSSSMKAGSLKKPTTKTAARSLIKAPARPSNDAPWSSGAGGSTKSSA